MAPTPALGCEALAATRDAIRLTSDAVEPPSILLRSSILGGEEVVLFELVHTWPDWYDGPIGGVADCGGRPHVFEALWDDKLQQFGPRFRLSPIDPETRDLAAEDWEIWLRWDEARRAGAVDQSTFPALPAERARHEELQALLAASLVLDPERTFIMCGEFRWTQRQPREPLAEVRWYAPA